MLTTTSTRRDFVASGARLLGGGWAASSLPLLAALSACARDAAQRGEPLAFLSADEGRAMGAFAAQVLPSDDTPGAEEAGVLHFVDLALDRYFTVIREPVRQGLADLDGRARAMDPAAAGFADLAPERQAALMREVEETPFFGLARMLTVMGMFSDPSHGGNRDGAGWQVLGVEHRASYQPPFGHYDAEHARQTGGGNT